MCAFDIRFRLAERMGWVSSGSYAEGPPSLSPMRFLSSCSRAFLFFVSQSLVALSVAFCAGSLKRLLANCFDSVGIDSTLASYPALRVWFSCARVVLPVYQVPELSAAPRFLGRDIFDRPLSIIQGCSFLGRSRSPILAAGRVWAQRR